MLHKTFSKNIFFIIFPSIAIWITGLLYIGDQTTIKILGDEFGYWIAAAWLTGKDWSDVASLNSYYGYGYGLLLAQIIKLPFSPLIKYKVAILFNILILNIVFLIIYYLIDNSKIFDKKWITSLISLTATLYVGNTFYIQFTMTETLLLLFFWLFILLLYSITKKYSFYKIILGTLLITYLYILHQRMLGVIILGILFLLYIQLKNKKYASAVLFLCLTGVLMVGCVYIKDLYQNSYLINKNWNLMHYNDYSGQIPKLKSAFSLSGLSQLIIGILGKIFYILSSTYLLAGIAVFSLFENIYKYIKERKISSKGIIELFILFSIASSIMISSIYLLHYSQRFDLLFYGRYNEYFISVLIVIGLLTLFKNDSYSWKNILLIYIIYFFITCIVHLQLPRDVADYTLASATGIYDTITYYNQNVFIVSAKSFVINLIIILLVNFLRKENTQKRIIYVCILLSSCFIITYTYNYGTGFLSWTQPAEYKEQMLAKYLQNTRNTNSIYYYATEGNNIDFLQFLLEDIPIKCIYDKTLIESLPNEAYLVTERSTKLTENDVLQNYVQVLQTNRLTLWKKQY